MGWQIDLTCQNPLLPSISMSFVTILTHTWLEMSNLGFDTAGFPNTVCAVDGCHIPIMRPHCDNPLAYMNRKQFYSVNLTGFCDSQRRFCHISLGHILGVGMMPEHFASQKFVVFLKKILIHLFHRECT